MIWPPKRTTGAVTEASVFQQALSHRLGRGKGLSLPLPRRVHTHAALVSLEAGSC